MYSLHRGSNPQRVVWFRNPFLLLTGPCKRAIRKKVEQRVGRARQKQEWIVSELETRHPRKNRQVTVIVGQGRYRASENLWDNLRVPFKTYTVLNRTGINEFKSSQGLHFYN